MDRQELPRMSGGPASVRTRPAHIAFFSGATHGHVNPMLGMVGELSRRGHQVSYTTTAEFAPLVAAAGATPVICPSTLPTNPAHWPADFRLVHLLLLRDVIATLPGVESAYLDRRPDIVVSEDPIGTGRILAAKWRIPTVQVWPFFAAKHHWTMAPQPPGVTVHPAVAKLWNTLSSLLAEHGIAMTAQEYLTRGTASGIVLLPPEFQRHTESFGPEFHFVGPCLRDPGAADPGFSGDTRPLLLMSLGSVNNAHPELYRMCAEAFADTSWRVVMSIGNRIGPADLGPLPDNVETYAQVPQLQVLAQARAFITHAGMNSVMEGLVHGVPMVAIPRLREQMANARRLADLSLGRVLLPQEVTATRLAEAVRQVMADRSVRDRLHAMRAQIRRAGGAGAAADVIEAQLQPAHLTG